jgi:hypothetical protein
VSESLYDLFATSESAAEDGKWFKFGKTIEVKIRRFKSKKSKKVREDLEAPYKRATKFGSSLPDDVSETIATEHIATGIIVDWKGVTDKQGNALKYSPAAAIELLNALPEFKDAVAEISLSLDNYRDGAKDDIEKN